MGTRISEQVETSAISDSDYILLDSQTLGYRKFKANKLALSSFKKLTQAEYDELSTSEKNNGTVYCIQGSSAPLKFYYMSTEYVPS